MSDTHINEKLDDYMDGSLDEAETLALDALIQETIAQVEADIDLGLAIGVNATPAMFLDGRRITEVVETPTFWASIAGLQPPLARPPWEVTP